MNALQNKYDRLDKLGKSLLQVLAFQHETASYYRLAEKARSFKLKRNDGRALTQTFVRELLDTWAKAGILTSKEGRPATVLMDRIVREGVFGEHSEQLLSLASKPQLSWLQRLEVLDFYVEFYTHKADAWNASRDEIPDASVPLLSPFCQRTYQQLTPELQAGYFSFVIPGWIAEGETDPAAMQAFRQVLDKETSLPVNLLPQLLEWALASGDRPLLERIGSQTGGKMRDVEGCLRLFSGDFREAFALLADTLSSRASARSLTKLGRLPSLVALLGAFIGDPSVSSEQALKATMSTLKSGRTPYVSAFTVAQQGLMFIRSPGKVGKLLSELGSVANSTLAKWTAGYMQSWLAVDEDVNVQINGLRESAKLFHSSGCLWLAAETYAAAGRAKLTSADKLQQLADQVHQQCKTASLVNCIQPQPAWSRTLQAIAMLGQKTPNSAKAANAEPTDRLIFEIHHNRDDFQLEVFQQNRKGSEWSKGRKIALSRLYQDYSGPEFDFLTPEDRVLCQALRQSTERNSYGYAETHTYFENPAGLRAMIGHPRIFLPNHREQPLEIIERPISLVVRKLEDSRIELFLDPMPTNASEAQIEKTGPFQLSVSIFTNVHLTLQSMLGKALRVPESASSKVIETITQLASVVTIHSEIDMDRGKSSEPSDAPASGNVAITPAKKVAGDSRPHVHLLPSGDGLRAEFYVQPFGATGPMCRPGEGGTTLFATIDGEATSAQRDLSLEVKQAQALIDQCETLPGHLTQAWSAAFATPIEALEFLEDLEPFAQSESVTIHWPKGQSLRLAGVAQESMMRVRIARDRDWFAASGELKLDRERTIDLMQLFELVSASTGRFIKLGDGEFLALTNNLRKRIDELRLFGDGRAVKGKLRFAAVHAALLEDLGEIKVTTDAHWKNCLKRMREATEISLHIPETLQAELRPYQQEGLAWMQRLAAWGVGGCLADDMGLGKTIQAIALLLHRAADGPAIVVAPTSVIHNWNDELIRFAPTLQPRILAEAPRAELLDSLGSRDVLLCSYGLMQNEIKKLEKVTFNTLLLDEAQAIKNAATQRSKAAKRLSSNCRFLLTGTPMENHLGELWNLMDFINPGLLGSAESFQSRFAIPIERDGDRIARQGLKRLVAPFILRRTKAQVLAELPSRTEMTLRIEPSHEEAAFYEAVRLRAIEILSDAEDGKPKTLKILAEIMRLRRACCHPKLVMPESTIASSKMEQVLQTLDELRSGNHRALIFSQFVDHLQLLREQLDERSIAYQYLDGSTPARTRKECVDAFQGGQGDVFLISLKAGGTGLNLTAADYVIHLDPWWNPAVEDQASDRAHRIGQKRPVTIYRMVLARILHTLMNFSVARRLGA